MQASIQHLPPPDLQTIAEKVPAPKAQQEMCKLVSLVLCVAVQSDRVSYKILFSKLVLIFGPVRITNTSINCRSWTSRRKKNL